MVRGTGHTVHVQAGATIDKVVPDQNAVVGPAQNDGPLSQVGLEITDSQLLTTC
jgi:hypothetical protein